MGDPILDEIMRRAQEQGGLNAPAPATGSRFAAAPPVNDGRMVATAQAPDPAPEKGKLSRFADAFRGAVPEPVRDVVGGALHAATSGEALVNRVGSAFGDGELGTEARHQIERVPVVGKPLAMAADIALAPTTWLTAGFGPEIEAALKGAGAGGKLAAMLMSPISHSPSVVTRAASEVIAGTAAMGAGEMATAAGAPAPVAALSSIVGGVVAVGAIGSVQGAAKTFSRDAAKAAGNNLGATDTRTFIRDLLPADKVLGEIKAPNDFEATAVGRGVNAMVNPSKNLEGDVAKAVNVYDKQVERGNLLSEVATQAALDSHNTGAGTAFGRGGSILDIGADGKITNVVPQRAGLSTAWGDVIEQRNAPALYGMNPQQTAMVKDIHQFVDELNDFRRANGLKVFKNPDAEIAHVSRVVKGIREIEVTGRTNQFLERVHESMAQGQAAGIEYSDNPREVLNLMAQATYREAAGAQLDELITPHVVAAKSVLQQMHPDVVKAKYDAIKGLTAARRIVRQQRSLAIGTRETLDAATLRATRRLGTARQRLGGIMGELKGADSVAAKMPNADAHFTELYQKYQAADDAAQGLRDVLSDGRSDQAAYDGAHRELVTATSQLSKVLGEIQQGGTERTTTYAAAPTERSATSLPRPENTYTPATEAELTTLTAGKDKLRRLDVAQKRVANAEQLAKDTKPDTGAARAAERDLVVARARLARVQGVMAAESSVTASATSMPLSQGRRLRAAQRAVDDMNQTLETLGDYRKTIPNVRSVSGPAITPAAATVLDDAQRANAVASARYARTLESTKASTVLPGYIFGNVTQDIKVGTWKGKFLPADADYKKLAERMNTLTGRPLPTSIDPFSKGVQDFASTVRLMSATGDAAAPFVNGLPLFGQNPLLWAKATAMQYKGMLDPSAVGRYAKANLEAVQEMAKFGVPIGDVEQYLAASQGGGIARPIHAFAQSGAGKQTLGRLESGYDGFVTVARTEMWKALRPVWDDSLDSLATYVRDATGALSSRSLGVGQKQRALESVWLGFSPRLMRSTMALIITAANPDSAAGQQAARSLLGLAAAGTAMAVATNVGIAHLNGEDPDAAWKRIADTLNPTTGKFLSVDVGGQRIGVGGQVRAITQFVAKATVNPSGFATANAFENPLINFYMGRGSVGVNVAGSLIEGATGEKVNVLPYESIDNLPDAALHLGSSLMPFVIQSQTQAKDLSKIDRAVAAATSFGGLNANEKSPADRITELATKQYGKPYAELTGVEQQAMERDHADLFVLRDQRRADMGGKEARDQQTHLKQIDAHRIDGERALVDAASRHLISDAQFRAEMKALQRDAAVLKRDERGAFDSQTADTNKQALTAWYSTFDQAKVPGTDLVDWDQQAVLEDHLLKQMTPEQKNYVDQRRVTKHAPEAEAYFKNEEIVKASGYYDAANKAFEQVRGQVPPEIKSYSDLVLAVNAAQDSGSIGEARLLKNVKNRVDSFASRARLLLRRQDPVLDNAMAANGRVSQPLAQNR